MSFEACGLGCADVLLCRFGQPIKMDEYEGEFFSDVEGAPRAAVKRVTQRIETELVLTSVNAPDW